MAWHFPQSGTTAPPLADGDDVFVAQQVFLNAEIYAYSGGGHEVNVAGTVATNGLAILLGLETGGANTITVETTGQVRAFENGDAVVMYGNEQWLVNHGLITQKGATGSAAYFLNTSAAPTTASNLVNSGTMDADKYGVWHDSSAETLTVQNSGTITGGTASFFSTGTSNDEITNSGKMIGDVNLGGGDDLYDGRLGTIDGDVFGDIGQDRLYAGAGNNRLFGQDGNDTLMGGAGADYLSGGSGTDRASYASATKAVTVSLANPSINAGDAKGDTYNSIENLSGSNYNDNVFGNSAKNSINGGVGNDIVKGYAGNDTLTGGTGGDIFVVNTPLNVSSNVDTITDFNRVDDTIQLDDAFFVGLAIGVLAGTAFNDIAISAADASDRILYNSDTGSLFFDQDGSGGTYAAVKFAVLTGSPTITAADFVVI
ncbi:calcium-binding protein [Mesorhizobium sp. CN2-181]|uniref:calcium-binding protein n=1 Tax=Mesorhizobium yinganensis TaxID=3157707 RepID=UPI0032B87FFD